MHRYWQYRKLHKLLAEEICNIRLEILFKDDLTDKLVLPETGIYSGDAECDTVYRMGAITKAVTIELPEVQGK